MSALVGSAGSSASASTPAAPFAPGLADAGLAADAELADALVLALAASSPADAVEDYGAGAGASGRARRLLRQLDAVGCTENTRAVVTIVGAVVCAMAVGTLVGQAAAAAAAGSSSLQAVIRWFS